MVTGLKKKRAREVEKVPKADLREKKANQESEERGNKAPELLNLLNLGTDN